MPIIPNPGPRPTVEPREDEIVVPGEFSSPTIGADETFYATGLPTALRVGLGATVTNNGTVWIETAGVQAFFVVGSQPDIYNNGSIYLYGQTQVELNHGADKLVNTGDIFAVSESGWARVVNAGRYAVVDNSGILAAQTIQSTFFSNSGNAVAIDSYNGAIINNHLGGQILAEAPDLAIAISLGGPNLDTGDPSVTNRGLIEAAATTAEGSAVGVYSTSEFTTVVNSGTIRAEIAIYNIGEIINQAGGLIEGLVQLEGTNDTIVNDGRIVGRVFMDEGDDSYSGSGEVDGYVDMGWGDDTFEGAGFSDIATGNRGNDELSGFGGNDLLLGGYGDDLIIGGSGNDGLFGEFGHDRIVTQGGDYVSGGSGDDRIELGDYRFEAIDGGTGFDVLAMATGTRNFSLSAMVAGNRIGGIDAIELRGNQNLAIDANSIARLADDKATLWVDATSTDGVHLAGSWTRDEDTSFGGVTYQTWIQGAFTVLVTGSTPVTANSTPAYGGLDAVAGGAAALRPGEAAGIDLATREIFVSEYVINDDDFVVTQEEIYFTVGEQPVFLAGLDLETFTNDGAIYSINEDTYFATGIWLTRQSGFVDVTNNGLILVEATGPAGDPDDIAFGTFGVSVEGDLINHGEMSVYSASGSVVGASVTTRAGLFNNSGDILAISSGGHAEGVTADAIDVFGQRSFSNTGLIYAEGVNVADPYYNDPVTTVHPVAASVATGARLFGNAINDGRIIAAGGENAVEGARSLGVALAPRSAGGLSLTNNGEISGTLSVFFYGTTTASGQGHTLVNNGLLVGDVHFAGGVRFSNGGNDVYDNTNGETRGVVYGFVGNDTFTGGAFADTFNGGVGNDRLDGGGNIDIAIVSGNRAAYRVTQTSVGVFRVVGTDGTDTLTNIEYLQFDDQTIRLLPGTGVSVNFDTSDPSVYQSAMDNIRDFDGNDLGGNGNWLRIGSADVDGDGDVDQILVNDAIGRFATVSAGDDGLFYFGDHGWAGETRVVGTYIDPLVQSGEVVAGSANDSQRRFQNDLQLENINRVLGADDYDGDGLQEVYFALTDGTAYLHAYMHADGNIQYANYQTESQVIDYLTANGYDASTWASWFASGAEGGAQEDGAKGAPVREAPTTDDLFAGTFTDGSGNLALASVFEEPTHAFDAARFDPIGFDSGAVDLYQLDTPLALAETFA